jgi:RNA polymerase sigma-70 factor, ECF subfamily
VKQKSNRLKPNCHAGKRFVKRRPSIVEPVVDLGETVSAAQSGDEQAFNDLVRATYDDTYSLALRLVGNAEDAKDVVQDTYLRAFRALARFRGDAQIGTWLFRITSNCASTLLTRRRKSQTDPLVEDQAVADDRTSHNPSAQSEANDVRAHIIDALSQLPEKLRSVIVLRDIYDLSHDAIAKQLDISETAAKVRLHRARAKLKEHLFGDEASEPDDASKTENEIDTRTDDSREDGLCADDRQETVADKVSETVRRVRNRGEARSTKPGADPRNKAPRNKELSQTLPVGPTTQPDSEGAA